MGECKMQYEKCKMKGGTQNEECSKLKGKIDVLSFVHEFTSAGVEMENETF